MATTTLNPSEVAAIQKDWKNREFVEVVKLNMLQVSRGATHTARQQIPRPNDGSIYYTPTHSTPVGFQAIIKADPHALVWTQLASDATQFCAADRPVPEQLRL